MMRKTGFAVAAALGALLVGGMVAGIAQAHSDSMHGSPEDRFKAMDTDGDGKISAAEFAAHHSAMLMEADLNGDGKVTLDEMKQAREKRREEREKRFFDSLDTNHDGAITEAELTARPNPMFDKLDANKDGFLSADELKAARDKWHKHHGGAGPDMD